MKKAPLKSIHQICNSLSLLSIIIAAIFSSLLSVVIFLNAAKNSLDSERQRLRDISPLIIRPIQANFIIGDERSLNVLKKYLIKRYRLSDLFISKQQKLCSDFLLTRYVSLFGKADICLSYLIPESKPQVYINLKSSSFHYNFSALLSLLMWVNVPLILLGFFISWVMRNKFDKSIVMPIKLLAREPGEFCPESSDGIALEVLELHEKLSLFMTEREHQKIKDSLIKITSQVAHDIRSPLAALDVAINIDFIPEDKRLFIRNATNRIRDIANNLLSQYSQKDCMRQLHSISEVGNEIIVDLMSSVISEKRLQYHYLPIEINFDFSKIKYCTFVRVSASELKRIASNLIDNSVEAISSLSGVIKIEVYDQDDFVMVSFADNGRGMTQKQIDDIAAGKYISHKKNGFGLGLSYAINKIKDEWQGFFYLESVVNEGTKITLSLPKSSEPDWLAQHISILSQQTVVILDDDKSIHESWKMRLSTHKIIHFYNSADFFDWRTKHVDSQDSYIYLFDYELLNDDYSGLDVFAHSNIYNHCYLVTSYYENQTIQARCKENGLLIIPKSFVSSIPIVYCDSFKRTIVLIDDNPLLRSAWTFAAEAANLMIHTFALTAAFDARKTEFDFSTFIYIDSELADGISGEVYAKALFDEGYQCIFLTTGHPPEKFKHMHWLKGVIGKCPPFAITGVSSSLSKM